MPGLKPNFYRGRSKATIQALERRMLLSAAANFSTPQFVEAPYQVLKTGLATPDGYSSPSGAPLTPTKMRDAYGLGNYNASNVTFNGVQGTGAGQTIAIVEGGSDPDIAADLTAFDNYWNLPAPPSFSQLNDTGGTSLPAAGDIGELDLDVEWAHVMAPGASITLYEGNLYTAMTTASKAPGVAAISISYTISGTEGISEFETPTGHTGVTFLAAAGDKGGQVDDPAKSPAVVAVGGTDLTLSGNNYSSETGWSSGGGGINTAESQPTYQKGIVTAFSTTDRTTPDVAMDADPGTGVAVYDEYDNGTSTPWSAIVGGTSLATPLMAGLVAVADQGRVAAGLTAMDGYTQTLPRLYELYNANYSANFHDITSGNNSHAAGTGYDLVTGLGSAKANNLVPDLAGADTITGQVFLDTSGNGVYGGSDTPMSGKTVYLDINNTGVQTSTDPTTTTNSSGGYVFTDQIGSMSGVVRLATLPSGDLHSTTSGSFTTSYDQTQTVNLGFYVSTYTAVAAPASVSATTTGLSVSGTGPADASTFLYTWAATTVPGGATPVFSANGTNAASNTTVTFNKAGAYTFTVTISDKQGSTVTSKVNVTVNQVLSSITVTPATTTDVGVQTDQFSEIGYDQFGVAMATQPGASWSILSGPGSINSSTGLYAGTATGYGAATIGATSGTVTGSASITLEPTVIDGTNGNDTLRLLRSGASLLVYLNNPIAPAYNLSYASLNTLTISSGAGTDAVNVDFSAGTPVPIGGLTVNSGVPAGVDTLIVTGTTGNDVATINSTTITFNSSPITYGNVDSILINGNGGSDTLSQTAQPGNAASLTFNGTTSGGPSVNDTLNVSGGTFSFAAPAAGAGIKPISLAALNISSGAVVSVGSAQAHGDRWVLALGSLNISGGQLNLGQNDAIIHGGTLSTISPMVGSGYAGGLWNGQGIISSAASGDATHLTTLGVIANQTPSGSALYTAFDGQSASNSDVLIKYTYIGDTNLDGKVDGSDYANIDNGYTRPLTGWYNGDLNYDQKINGSDYTLMDNAFNTQGTSLALQIATPATSIAPASPRRNTAVTVISDDESQKKKPSPFATRRCLNPALDSTE